jgi:hypothetical protein
MAPPPEVAPSWKIREVPFLPKRATLKRVARLGRSGVKANVGTLLLLSLSSLSFFFSLSGEALTKEKDKEKEERRGSPARESRDRCDLTR